MTLREFRKLIRGLPPDTKLLVAVDHMDTEITEIEIVENKDRLYGRGWPRKKNSRFILIWPKE